MSVANEQLKVCHVSAESQAYWAGVKVGWVVRKINGDGILKDEKTLTFTSSVKSMLGEASKNETYTIEFLLPEKDFKQLKDAHTTPLRKASKAKNAPKSRR